MTKETSEAATSSRDALTESMDIADASRLAATEPVAEATKEEIKESKHLKSSENLTETKSATEIGFQVIERRHMGETCHEDISKVWTSTDVANSDGDSDLLILAWDKFKMRMGLSKPLDSVDKSAEKSVGNNQSRGSG
jgi:hypothetical protein